MNHVSPRQLRGGWLGVDIFFVLSGYLITSILLNQYNANGRIDLRTFYERRLRRLLPALILLLAVVGIVKRLAPNAAGFGDVRGDGASALAYIANWHFIAVGASYFNVFAPSPLRHLWSLAIEEQFYIVWPMLMLLVLKRFGLRGGWRSAIVPLPRRRWRWRSFTAAATRSRVRTSGPTRTRTGCCSAARSVFSVNTTSGCRTRESSALGLAGIAFAFVRLDGTAPLAYRGGIAAVGLLTALVIAALVASDGKGPAAWALQQKPIVGLGLISYGVYLWHWPILEFVTADRVGISGWQLIVVQLGLTLAISIASFVLIERPVRSGWPKPQLSWIAARPRWWPWWWSSCSSCPPSGRRSRSPIRRRVRGPGNGTPSADPRSGPAASACHARR